MKIFDTVADMIAATLSHTGQLVAVKGHSTAGDMGAATYLIKTVAEAAADGDTIDDTGAGFNLVGDRVAVLQNTVINSAHYGSFTGTPEGNGVLGRVGYMFTRTDGGAGTTLYVKESGNNTDTGWVAK